MTLLSLALLSCQSTHPVPAVELELKAAPNVREANQNVEATPALPPRFCHDDLYSQYIREEFSRTNVGPKSPDISAHEESFKALRYQLPLEFSGAPISPSPRVLSWISYFTGRGRSDFLLWMVRSATYRETLVPLLQKEGLAPDFFFLAMIESGFSNYAFSRARATGTWQFMKPTAESYGLEVNDWVDERRDPNKSTLAAARYLKDLYAQFGDWYLALAAYNAGPTRVVKAIRATQSRDYWVLAKSPYLRQETKEYVPKLLAALIVASHASTYGFNVVGDVRHRSPTATIELYHSYRVSEIAARLAIPESNLLRWNPELLQAFTPPIHKVRRKSYSLKIPRSLQQTFGKLEPLLEKIEISDVLVHRIKRGETLASIARHYKVSVKKILETNPKVNARRLKLGHHLNVPVASVRGESMPLQIQAKADLPSPSVNVR